VTATTKTSQPVVLWHPIADRHRLEPSPAAAALYLEVSADVVRWAVETGECIPSGWYCDWAAPSQVEQYNAEKGRARLDRERLERSRRPRNGYHRLG
jgi:hypothetical protein